VTENAGGGGRAWAWDDGVTTREGGGGVGSRVMSNVTELPA